ncbi:hypothetical protein AAF712_007315 [Marasmius tenuissimus]|uniref:Uncharacterized protein n=1 Tax=Marasmius tenuissimus TaxID=585030 RepID=A0ABR2ZWX6_9AGAR
MVEDERRDRVMRTLDINSNTYDALAAWFKRSNPSSANEKATAHKKVAATSAQPVNVAMKTAVKKPAFKAPTPSNLKNHRGTVSDQPMKPKGPPQVRWAGQESISRSSIPAKPRIHVPSVRSVLKKPSSEDEAPRTIAQTRKGIESRQNANTTRDIPNKGKNAVPGPKNRGNRSKFSDTDSSRDERDSGSESSESGSDSSTAVAGVIDVESDDEREVEPATKKRMVKVASGMREKAEPSKLTSKRSTTSASTTNGTSSQGSSTEKKFFELHMLKRKVELSMGSVGRESAAWMDLSEVAKRLDDMATMQIDEMIELDGPSGSHEKRKVRSFDTGKGEENDGMTERDRKRRKV